MSCGRDVGEEDAHLAVFNAPSASAVLVPNASGVLAPFGEAAFIDHQHRKDGSGLRWRVQELADLCTQNIANPVLVPDRTRKQALDTRGTCLSGVFSDLPAVFSGNLAENGLQIEQGVVIGFGTRKVGSQALMELTQSQRPFSYLLQRWSELTMGWRWWLLTVG